MYVYIGMCDATQRREVGDGTRGGEGVGGTRGRERGVFLLGGGKGFQVSVVYNNIFG